VKILKGFLSRLLRRNIGENTLAKITKMMLLSRLMININCEILSMKASINPGK
jgi:hypothetical protein